MTIRQALGFQPEKLKPAAFVLLAAGIAGFVWLLQAPIRMPWEPSPAPVAPPRVEPQQSSPRGNGHLFVVFGNGYPVQSFDTLKEAKRFRRGISGTYRIATLGCTCGKEKNENDHRRIQEH